MMRNFLFSGLLLLLGLPIYAQDIMGQINGRVVDAETNTPLSDATAVLSGTGRFAVTDAGGKFVISELAAGSYTLVVTHAGHYPYELVVAIDGRSGQSLTVEMRRDLSGNNSGDIPTVTLDEAEAETEGAGEVANLLQANRDIFQTIAGYGWSFFRFRERGYDSENFPVLMNGVTINDPETGIAFFGEFGGLNDVLRNRQTAIGMNAAEFAFGGIGGATLIDTRAGVQRKQLRASYAVSNRIYRNRAMITYNTGLLPGGWAVSISGSHRWAQEGYIPGTFFDGYSYFLSVDKKFGNQHALNITVMGAPNRRGRAADSFQEMYDIAGTNYYNPLWGFQNGEKRNAQVQYNHQPIGLLRYDWTPENGTSITLTGYAQGGRNSFTRLNWLNGSNPAPDFNRRLPSSLYDTTQIDDWAALLASNEALRQIDWAAMYDANRNNPQTVQNADGIAGNTVTGNRSTYIVEDQRSDSREAGGNLIARHVANSHLTFNGGLSYVWYKGENFKTIEDLLGGDYWVDYDFYSLFDSGNNIAAGNSDLQTLNNVVRKGDVFGYNYDENIRRANGWMQAQYNDRHFQYYIAGEIGQTQFWREGYMQNGRFPNNSLGTSEKVNFSTWTAKGGLTWKINGRNYLYANGLIGTRAPQFRDAFLSPRVRSITVPELEVSEVKSVEGGYILRAPNYRLRLTGYFSEFKNETESVFANAMTVSEVLGNLDLSFLNLQDDDAFLSAPVFFGSAIMRGVGRRHAGIEAAIEAKVIPAITLTAAGSLGQYIYTDRPNIFLQIESNDIPLIDLGKVYQKDFYVPRTPQKAASFSIKYESRQFWFASLTANFADGMYYDFDRIRRTERYVESLTPQSPVWNTVIDQIKAPSAFTLDFFGGKSWRIKRKYFIYLNAGINNILNNKEVVISGRDSYRNAFRNDIADPRFYTTELIYAPGLNYFISLAVRI